MIGHSGYCFVTNNVIYTDFSSRQSLQFWYWYTRVNQYNIRAECESLIIVILFFMLYLSIVFVTVCNSYNNNMCSLTIVFFCERVRDIRHYDNRSSGNLFLQSWSDFQWRLMRTNQIFTKYGASLNQYQKICNIYWWLTCETLLINLTWKFCNKCTI